MADSTAKNRSAIKKPIFSKYLPNPSTAKYLPGGIDSAKYLPSHQTYVANKNNALPSHAEYLVKKNAKDAKTSPSTTPQPLILEPTADYRWNLPPHQWSLPVDPHTVNNIVKAPASDTHATRRGRIFVSQPYYGVSAQYDQATNSTLKNDTPTENKYGFQFLWNPDTFTQSTSVNMNVTPSETDATSGLTGLVAANSTVNFVIRIDRTNDFACAKSLLTFGNDIGTAKELYPFYAVGQPLLSEKDFGANLGTKITDLMKYGTASDIEYIYKTINGDSLNAFMGKNTSNIGYLRPTIIRLDLGPQKHIGIVSNLSVSHSAFTRDLIPIRSDVTISIDLRAGTGYATSGVTGSNV